MNSLVHGRLFAAPSWDACVASAMSITFSSLVKSRASPLPTNCFPRIQDTMVCIVKLCKCGEASANKQRHMSIQLHFTCFHVSTVLSQGCTAKRYCEPFCVRIGQLCEWVSKKIISAPYFGSACATTCLQFQTASGELSKQPKGQCECHHAWDLFKRLPSSGTSKNITHVGS
jgi:hypothetical protein